MDTTEGVHKPLGKYIFNNVNFGMLDPLIPRLREAGYKVAENPTDPLGILVTFPVKWEGVEFTKVYKGTEYVEFNTESALEQLDRYKMIQLYYNQQNTSITVSYSSDEIPDIIEWIRSNWDIYVGVSFLYRADPSKTAEDLGYLYLPQEVVTKEVYDEYVSTLREIDITTGGFEELEEKDCVSGACPVK